MLPLIPYMLALATVLLLPGASTSSIPSLSPRKVGGINCRGSHLCNNFKGVMTTLHSRINNIAPGRSFTAGTQLACAGYKTKTDDQGINQSWSDGVCAFVGENTPSYTMEASAFGNRNSAADVVGDLINHGCEACGTAPTNREGNDLGRGAIVVNYVTQVCATHDELSCFG